MNHPSDQHETPKAAVERLAATKIKEGFTLEALHHYEDLENGLSFYRIRLKHPETGKKWIRPLMWTPNGYRCEEPLYPKGKPLYRLKDLVQQPDMPVLICEGEWCVDHAIKLGLCATTSGSAQSAHAANWSPLKGRSILIWPDNDLPGKHYANEVAAILLALDCTVNIIDVKTLGIGLKADLVDWLDLHPHATSKEVLMLNTAPNESFYQTGKNENDQPKHKTVDSSEEQSQASILVDFVQQRAALFHDRCKEVYVQDNETGETRRLESRLFRDWLIGSFYHLSGKSPREQAVREAVSTLSGLGRFVGECHDVYIRSAYFEGAYYLDLCEPSNSKAVKITPGKWEVIDPPPVKFLRLETMCALPTPIPGGDFSLLWQLANIPLNSRLLITAWLAECLRPITPYPVLELLGEHGSAKSTTQQCIRRLIDPNLCDLRVAPKNVEDVFVGAQTNLIVSYENISHLPAPLQDAFCTIATGGGFAKRKLYSNAEESIMFVKRPIMVNGISAAITAQDLLDRAVSIEMPLITERSETTCIWELFEHHQASILGGLLDIFTESLVRLPDIRISTESRPRLYEFALLGIAIAETLGKSESEFLEQFTESRHEAIARTIDASPVATALIDWFNGEGRYKVKMTAKSLFEAVEKKRPLNSEAWPRSAKGFADALRRIAPALRPMGIDCRSAGKIGGNIYWQVSPIENL